MSIARELLQLLACPACREGELVGLDAAMMNGDLPCSACGARYAVREGILRLLPPGFDEHAVHDDIEHAHAHKRRQARHYDAAMLHEFEVTRPHGAPAAYRELLESKFERSIAGLLPLNGATVVDACCGSGMGAEMLARRGARVIAIDVSEGCVRRARERARRYGVDYLAVVGDVERLPLRDRSVDVAYVHDGLHHLDNPANGVRELARVARTAVSISEPADAFGTAVAVRLGMALAREEAGNRVARMRAGDTVRALARAGFDARARRYLMYYRHEPGRLMRLASGDRVLPLYRAGVATADALAGRWGNKLQVTGVRRAA
jgi:SAM-dependent methyltransferase